MNQSNIFAHLQRGPVRGVRARVLDHALMTFDGATPVQDHSPLWRAHQRPIQINPGAAIGWGAGGRPGLVTHDGRTCDSTGAFLVGELERLDQKMHEPLVMVSWGRDIDLREDVTIADEVSSFTLTTFGAAGSLGAGNSIGNGKAWIGKTTDQIGGIGLDISKVPNPLTPWGMELKYDILELESAAKAGRPIDQQKYAGIQLKHQMDIDEQVYIGDTSLGVKGLLNQTAVTPANLANGASGSPLWNTKTPAEILTDFNTAISAVWNTAAYAIIPSRIGIAPAAFGYLSTQLVSAAGDKSILKYVLENNVLTTSGAGKLDIVPMKWCNGAGAGGTLGTGGAGHDRMIVYTKDKDRVRFPMTMIQRTPIQYDGIYHKSTYFCRLGVIELVYPETMGYFDGGS